MPSPRQRERVFVVEESSCSLATILRRLAPDDLRAISEGRIYVDDRRVESEDFRVDRGSKITCYVRRDQSAKPRDTPFSIVARRGDLVVASKPSAFTCEPDRTGSVSSLREAVADQLGARNVHVLTRLDVGVSGLVLMALTHAACSVATKLQNQHRITKSYFAMVKGTLGSDTVWIEPPCANRNAVTEVHALGLSGAVGWSHAIQDAVTLLRVKPITGRKHQIRIHSSQHGHSLLGDRRYGGPAHAVKSDGTVIRFERLMLHAYQLVIPWESEDWTTTCAAPPDMIDVWRELGGDDSCLKT
jgi:23S rRNA pseudouridine1911/1915/1917 synthase